MKIGKYLLGDDQPCYIIAEAGLNHNGELDAAKNQIKLAAKSGANAIKFQNIKANKFISKKADLKAYNFFKQVEFSVDQFNELARLAEHNQIDFLCSVFDIEGIYELERIGVKAHKIASGEITNLPLINEVSKTKKPIILSTGMSILSEISRSVEIIQKNNNDLCLMHCVSMYPAPVEVLNLKTIPFLKYIFNTPVGFSDHSRDVIIPSIAVTLGANVIEKHFTANRADGGPDHELSLEPEELAEMINRIRVTEKSLGVLTKTITSEEKRIQEIARKSLFVNSNLKKGMKVKINDLSIKRPATGIAPEFIDLIEGLEVSEDMQKDDPITWNHFKKKFKEKEKS